MNALTYLANTGVWLFNSAASFINPPMIPFFDMSESQFQKTAAKMDKVQNGDIDHILNRSINPNYEIPTPAILRLKESGIMDGNSNVDPQVVKIVETLELASFHVLEGGGVGPKTAKANANRIRKQPDLAYAEDRFNDAKELERKLDIADRQADAHNVRSYRELTLFRSKNRETNL